MPVSLLTSGTSPFVTRCPEMPSGLGLLRPWSPADAGVPSAGLWLSMLICVSILCTCLVTYICRMDWRKAAEEVTACPRHRALPGGTSSVPWLGSQWDETAPRAPSHRPALPRAVLQWPHDGGHVPISSFPPHVHSTASRFPFAPRATLGWGQESQSRQGDGGSHPCSPEHHLVPQQQPRGFLQPPPLVSGIFQPFPAGRTP